jgi:hypothetical protein
LGGQTISITKYLLLMRLLLLSSFVFTLSCLSAQIVISELHYDNVGSDVNEAIELTGPAGTDLTDYQVVFYNGSNGNSYETLNGTDFSPVVLADQLNGFGTAVALVSGIQNGSPDGVALIAPNGTVLEFLSYEGDFTANNGPAAGMMSTDIGASEGGSASATGSVSNNGAGWQLVDPATFGQPDPGLVAFLPVTLTSLTATSTPKSTMVRWTTGSESANDFFAVERSLDGRVFQELGRLAGRGTSNSAVTYEFEDNAPVNGNSYYRLRQVDFDGTTTFSDFVLVQREGLGLSAYPNPVANRLFLGGATEGEATITDMNGRTLRMVPLTGDGIDVSNLRAGTYLLRVATATGVETVRFVRQ